MKSQNKRATLGAALFATVLILMGCGGSDPYAIVECVSPSVSATPAATPSSSAQPTAESDSSQDDIFPIDYTTQLTFSPAKLEEPDGSWQLGSAGPVVLTYDSSYLTQVQRANGDPSFRGIAPLDPVSVPAGVKEQYGDVSYVIAPVSCTK